METRRLELLAELSRLGSMRAVADLLGISTSTVSQQIAALGHEVGAELIEPDGRRVRLTPDGRRLAEHARKIVAAVEAARLDLGPRAEPGGTVRVAGFETAIRTFLLPIIAGLTVSHPRIRVLVREHEPAETLELLATDQVDLGLTYDHNLSPVRFDAAIQPIPLWTARWWLAVPADAAADGRTSAEVFASCRGFDWIGNSRNSADEVVIRTLAGLAGFTPRLTHQADSLSLVQEMVAAGLGVALLPAREPTRREVRLVPLADPPVELRAYAVARQGRLSWAPLDLLTGLLREASRGHATGWRPAQE